MENLFNKIKKQYANIIPKRYVAICDSEKVTELIVDLQKIAGSYNRLDMRVGNCGWKNDRMYFVRFSMTIKEFNKLCENMYVQFFDDYEEIPDETYKNKNYREAIFIKK